MRKVKKPVLVPLVPPERKRVYVFPGGERLALEEVTHLEVTESGKHRYQCGDGRKGFVNTGWLWIELDMDEWTF